MCTRLLSGVLTLTILCITSATGLQKAPSAQKLPSTLMSKHPLAYFSFDRKGRDLSSNQIETLQTIQLRGAHFTPEGLDQGALRCTGSAQVRIPLPVIDELTFSAWFLPTDLARKGSFSACSLQSNQHTLTISLYQDGTIQMQQTSPFSQSSSSVNTGRGLPANQWLHLALVATPQQSTLYLNGQQAGVFYMPAPLSGTHLAVANQAYRGRIDEIALFKQSLSRQDVQALFEMYQPAFVPLASEPAQADTWEAKAVHTYSELTQAINSGNWSAAATQATAASDLVAAYLRDKDALLAKPAQELVKTNLARASTFLKAFHSAVGQAKYHEASDLFDRLDEVWETLEGQLNLPVSNADTPTEGGMLGPGMQQFKQFSQTRSSNSSAMPGGGFSGGMSMGFGGANSGAGGGISMSSSAGPNDQFRFNSSGVPGQGFMGQSLGQMPPQMVQQQIHMQCQRMQMTLMALKISLQSGNLQMAQTHARRLPSLLAPLTPPDKVTIKPQTRVHRRTLDLSTLPTAQQTALKAKVRRAKDLIKHLDSALQKQQIEGIDTQIQSLETVIQGLSQWPNTSVEPKQPPQE